MPDSPRLRTLVAVAAVTLIFGACGGSSDEEEGGVESLVEALKTDFLDEGEADAVTCKPMVRGTTVCEITQGEERHYAVGLKNGTDWGGIDAITCQELEDPNVRRPFVTAVGASIEEDYVESPNYDQEIVVEGVKADIDTFCDRATNPRYTPGDDIIDSVSSVVE